MHSQHETTEARDKLDQRQPKFHRFAEVGVLILAVILGCIVLFMKADRAPPAERYIREGGDADRRNPPQDPALGTLDGVVLMVGNDWIGGDPLTGKRIPGRKAKLELVLIPAATFLMGSPDNEAGRDSNEGPVHEVAIGQSFYMGKYEVTQGQWQAVMESNPSHFKGDDNLPVEQVSWNECRAFCKKVTSTLPRDGIIREIRLPTEVEWEYACRAGTTTPFHYGETITSDKANCDGRLPAGAVAGPLATVSSYLRGDGNKGMCRWCTTVVGSFSPNGFGLHDMHGNVWEWCGDEGYKPFGRTDRRGHREMGINAYMYRPDAPIKPDVDVPWDAYRVQRGGSWYSCAVDCRAARRGLVPGNDFRDRAGVVGFRVVGVASISPRTP